MKTLDDSSIKALISLLEDPSEIIYNEIHQTIRFLGADGIPHLQSAFDTSESELQRVRIAEILDELKLTALKDNLNDWKEFQSGDLLAGLVLIAQYGYPNLKVDTIEKTLHAIEKSVSEKIEGKKDLEIVDLLSQTILFDFGFNGNIQNYSGIDNSFINKIIENKTSNPIGLSVLYLLIAERLKINLVGINSPAHFILGYSKMPISKKAIEDGSVIKNISFFIDPFNNGKKINSAEFDYILQNAPNTIADNISLAATNVTIIKRMLNNLIHALYIKGEKSTATELLALNDKI